MRKKAENKSNKFVLLATYAVAVLCLLLGLILPLFNGKEMLMLKLGDAFKSLSNKGDFGLSNKIYLFGIEKLSFDFSALVVVLYTAITAISVLAIVPIVLSIRKKGKLARKLYYGIEITAVIVLSLIFLSTLAIKVCYNFVIAACGTTIALLTLAGLNKGKTLKIVLFLLSVIGFLALFDFVTLLSKEAAFGKLSSKISSGFTEGASGADYLELLFASKISTVLSAQPNAKFKALILLAAIAATVVLINFFIDAVKLSFKRSKKNKFIFDIVRYGIAFVVAVATLVTVLICKDKVGLMLIFVLIVTAIQLAIVLSKYIIGIRNKANNKARDSKQAPVNVIDVAEPEKVEQPLLLEGGSDSVTDDYSSYDNSVDEVAEEEQANYEDAPLTESNEVPVPPVPDDDGYIDPALDEQYQQLAAQQQEAVEEEPDEFIDEDLEDTEIYEPEEGTTYLVENAEDGEQSEEVAEVEEEAVEEPAEETEEVEEVEEVAETEEPAEETEEIEEVAEAEEPVEEAEEIEEVVEAEEPSKEAEEIEEVAEEEIVEEPEQDTDDGLEEPAQNPFREEIKPYNPYERHNNPFKAFDEPPQPYNPYRQQEPVQNNDNPIQSTTRFAYDKPLQSYKQFEQPVARPVKPLQPRPIIQEFKPVPPVSEQPPQRPVYTIDTLYAGPIDEFIRKLSNDERIEFAQTFLEKNRGNLGSIPDYVVGGDNKKFFSSAFIYLGRIRGMVSDGLLNKMYKELNLL